MSKIKSGTLNAIGSVAYSCLALFYMVLITRVNGLEQAGVFSLLFALCNLVYNIGIYSGRTYQVSDRTKGVTDSDYLVQRTITTALMLVVGIAICISVNEYRTDILLAILILILKTCDAYSEVLYGIMQKHNHLEQVGISMIIKAMGIMFVFTVADVITKNIYAAFTGTLVIVISEIIIYEYPCVKKYLKHTWKIESVRKIFRKGSYACLIAVFANYLTSAPKYALASHVTAEEQAIFNIISMPATIIVLCALFIVQPFIVELTEYHKSHDTESFTKCLQMCLLAVTGIGSIFMLGGYLLGVPLLNTVYGTDITAYKPDLMVILFGAVLSGVFNIQIAALTVMQKTKRLMIITAIISVITFLFANETVALYGLRGGAFAFAFSMLLGTISCLV